MGLFESIRKSRAKTKAEIAAAKKRAKQEAKEAAKLDLKREKLLDQAEKRLVKEEKNAMKKQRKHEDKLAKNELKKIQEGRINAKTMNRWVGALRVALPVILPLIYRGITALQEQGLTQKASKVGVTPEQMAQYAGHGAELKARIEGVRNSLDASSQLPSGFKRDADDRLKELSTATDNAEYMAPEQRRRAHAAIERDIKSLTAQIQDKIKA